MSDRGVPDEFEVTWNTGHVDRVLSHQVTWDGGRSLIFDDGPSRPKRVRFHAEIDGQWRLMLEGMADDIRTIRNLTQIGDRFE